MRIRIMNTNIFRKYQLMSSIPAISSCIDKRAIKNMIRLFTTQAVLYMHYRTLPLWCDGIRRPYSIYRLLQKELWWRHQMETFSAVLALCAGNLPITGEFLSRRPVTQSFYVFFDLRLNNGCVNNRDAGYRAHHDVTSLYAQLGMPMCWGGRKT